MCLMCTLGVCMEEMDLEQMLHSFDKQQWPQQFCH